MIREIKPTDWRADRFPLLHELTSQFATESAKIGFFVENIKFATVERAEVTIKSPNYSAEEVSEFKNAVDAAETTVPGKGSKALQQGKLNLDEQDDVKEFKARKAVKAALLQGRSLDVAVEAVCHMTNWPIKKAVEFVSKEYHNAYNEKLRKYATEPETNDTEETPATPETTDTDTDGEGYDIFTGDPFTTNECERDAELDEIEVDDSSDNTEQKGE